MKDSILFLFLYEHRFLLLILYCLFMILVIAYFKATNGKKIFKILETMVDDYSKFDKDRKEKTNKEKIKKGHDFERYVAEHYKSIGYEVSLNGIIHGKKDNGIDIICSKENELILVQCKNWKENSKYKVTHLILKAFIGCCSEYVIKNQLFEKKVAFHFVTSNNILDASAKKYLQECTTLEYKNLSFN